MKNLYCKKCGTKLNIKFGMIPHKCNCGAEFELTSPMNIKKIIDSIIFFVLLMSPLVFLIHFVRQFLQASILLYAMTLMLVFFWYRVVEVILIRLGLVIMTNLEIK